LKSNVPFIDSEEFRRHRYIEYYFMTKYYSTDTCVRSVDFCFAQFIDKNGVVRRRCKIAGGNKATFDPVKKKVRSISWSKGRKRGTLHIANSLGKELDFARGLGHEVRGSKHKLENCLRQEWIEEAIPLYLDYPFLPSSLLEKLNGFRGIKELTKYYTGSRSKGCTSAMTRFLKRENQVIRMTRAHDRLNGHKTKDFRLDLLKRFGRQMGPEWCIQVLDDPRLYAYQVARLMRYRLKDYRTVAPIPAVAEYIRDCFRTGIGDYYVVDVIEFLMRRGLEDNVRAQFPAAGVNEAHTLMLRALGVGQRVELQPTVVPRLNTTFDNHGRPNIEVFEEGYTLRYPKDSEELREWGISQHHCISGYAGQHERKECHLFGVFVNHQLKACGQILGGGIQQFFAACNQKVPQDLLKKTQGNLQNFDWSPAMRYYRPQDEAIY